MPNNKTGTAQSRDGTQIVFRQSTSGKSDNRVVLIHSLALDGSIWKDVSRLIAENAEVLTYDCRGHGRSGHAPGPYTPELFAHDLADLLDHLGWQDAVVAGCSMGGCVAQAFAGLYPDRVKGLILIDTTAWYGAEAPEQWRKRAEAAKTKGLSEMAAFQITRWFGDQFRAEQKDRMQEILNIFLANDVSCYAATCDMLGNADLRRYLPSIRCPTTVIVGEEDYATPVSAAQALVNAISGAELVVIPKARHLTPIERPDVIARHISSHLQHTERAGASA